MDWFVEIMRNNQVIPIFLTLGMGEVETKQMLDIIPACYAVCYVFGTVGSAWIIANLGPVLLGGLNKVKEETVRIEEEMDSGDLSPTLGLWWPIGPSLSGPIESSRIISTAPVR